jgi:hypothetical protein
MDEIAALGAEAVAIAIAIAEKLGPVLVKIAALGDANVKLGWSTICGAVNFCSSLV